MSKTLPEQLSVISPTLQIHTESPVANHLTTVLPPYLHYSPSEGSDIHLEFKYPSSWVLTENLKDANFLIIGLDDPRIRTLPTPSPEIDFFPKHDFGSVSIWIWPSESDQTPDTELESHKESYSEHPWMTVLDDYKITIDGFDAYVLEYQMSDKEFYTSLMFARRIFFVIGGQFHEIYYTVAEKDREGEFDQGFDYFLSSLKFIP